MKSKIIILILFYVLSHSLLAQNSQYVYNYIDQYKEIALKFQKEYGIPATITLAQAILESKWGKSKFTQQTNNHFGIKAGSSWKGKIAKFQDDEVGKSSFRCYNSAEESFRDYARLISGSRNYRQLFNINIYDYRGWAHGLKKANYATYPKYAEALIGIIDQYKLYEINGGAKLKPGKTITIITYVEKETPVFDEECVLDENEISEEQMEMEEAMKMDEIEINNIHCTGMMPGENITSISRKHNISVQDLLKYNDMTSIDQTISTSIVFLEKKKKKYEGPQDFYIAKDGESLYDVSQKFGIQLHSLAQLNKMNDSVTLKEGSRIFLK